jgi:hypothetical protein
MQQQFQFRQQRNIILRIYGKYLKINMKYQCYPLVATMGFWAGKECQRNAVWKKYPVIITYLAWSPNVAFIAAGRFRFYFLKQDISAVKIAAALC